MANSDGLEGVINFRDVGRTVNEFLDQRRLREGVFYRSARLDEATARDRDILRARLGIKTVIDLRTKTEHLKQVEKHQAQQTNLAHGPSNAAAIEALQIEGLNYREIKITGRPFERHLLRQLSWLHFFKFIFLYLLGYRMAAIRILSREVMLPRGLVGLGTDTLDQSGAEICMVLLQYTVPNDLPSVVHCTQGKDRTGIICVLILMILEIPMRAIEHDYFLTDAALMPERSERIAEVHELGLTDAWASTAPTMVSAIEKHVNNGYGGLNGYLDHIGFGEEQRTKLREALLY